MRPIMNVNLKLLQVFLLVAEHCSFRSAAIQANRSQSATSTQIKQLEGQLGVALVQPHHPFGVAHRRG